MQFVWQFVEELLMVYFIHHRQKHNSKDFSISLSFDLLESWIFCCFPFWILSCFGVCFLYFFGCSESWLPWIRLRFHCGKLLTFSEILAMGYAMYKIEFTSRKTVCPPFLLSLKYMTCHVCTLKIELNISHVTFLQWMWTKPHSSSLTNVENLTSNFSRLYLL